jgi:hypothetical protein
VGWICDTEPTDRKQIIYVQKSVYVHIYSSNRWLSGHTYFAFILTSSAWPKWTRVALGGNIHVLVFKESHMEWMTGQNDWRSQAPICCLRCAIFHSRFLIRWKLVSILLGFSCLMLNSVLRKICHQFCQSVFKSTVLADCGKACL